MAKRVYDTKKQLYAVGVSRIDSYLNRPNLVGQKRRVFIKVKSLLSAQYMLLNPPASTPVPAQVDAFERTLPVPVPCGEAA